MPDREVAAMIGGVTVLERAMNYTLGNLVLATDDTLNRPTPCADWDVHALLVHMSESLAVLCAAVDVGRIDLVPSRNVEVAAELTATVRSRARHLLGALAAADQPSLVSVGGRLLPSTIVAGAGAIEVAVHGWDLAQGCGYQRPIPASLVEELLELAMVIVTDADRPGRFAPPVVVPELASPTDRFEAYLGRHP